MIRLWWRRIVARLVDRTPGIGNTEEAKKAVMRSEQALKDVAMAREHIAPDIAYVQEVVRNNHFRDKVVAAFRERPVT